MIIKDINLRFKQHEYHGEKLVSIIRLVLALIYTAGTTGVAIFRGMQGFGFIPMRAHIVTAVFLVYSVFIYIYVRRNNTVQDMFKYICVIIDMTILGAGIWVSCTYLEISAPLPYLYSRALFFILLILAGVFRQSSACAYFSGILAAVIYISVVIINRNALDLPYFFILENRIFYIYFPLYNEFFKFVGMILTGWITGWVSKHNYELFCNMIISEAEAVDAASQTVEQTRNMAETIKKSTDSIFLSSKDIFSTANNQAASVMEIESTIKENTQIAADIADKTANVAVIALKIENDITHCFSVLEQNVNQVENIKEKNDKVISGIISLSGKISKIRDIIGTINAITDQTKVIAFNASLEAASAGEKGKRFSVVASEVNRLADDIAVLTKQIRLQAEEIQSSSTSLIISGEESAENINEGNSLIKELKEIFREIKSGVNTAASQAQTITVSTQKQQQSSEQINVAILDISRGLSNFLQSTGVVTSSAEKLTEMIQEFGILLTAAIDKKKEDHGIR